MWSARCSIRRSRGAARTPAAPRFPPGRGRRTPQRMEAEPALERRRGLLLLAMGGHQGGVHVNHERRTGADGVVGGLLTSQRPGPPPRGRPCRGDRGQRGRSVGGKGVDQPGHGRIGGNRAEHLRCGTQLREVGQAVPADRQRHRQIQQDLARVVAGQPPSPRCERLRQDGVEAYDLRGTQQEDRARVGNDAPATPVDRQTGISIATLLHQKCSRPRADRVLDKPDPRRSGAPFALLGPGRRWYERSLRRLMGLTTSCMVSGTGCS
jgi:hypothetical protein